MNKRQKLIPTYYLAMVTDDVLAFYPYRVYLLLYFYILQILNQTIYANMLLAFPFYNKWPTFHVSTCTSWYLN